MNTVVMLYKVFKGFNSDPWALLCVTHPRSILLPVITQVVLSK